MCAFAQVDVMNNCEGAPHYYRRNSIGIFMGGILETDILPKGGQIQYGWPEERASAWRQLHFLSKSDAHFQCGGEPAWPGAIVRMKMPINGDCRDVLNQNAANAILHRLCVRTI